MEINSGALESNASLSCDGLTIFLQRYAPGGDIWWARRESTSEPFSVPSKLGPLVNTGFFDGHPSISPDWPAPGSKLYFARCIDQGCDLDIYEATWVPDCNDNGIDDSLEIEDGAVDDVNANGVPDECEDEVFPRFLRADCNADREVNLTDAVCTLDWLFAGGAKPGCVAALNTNGDDVVDVADPVSLLSFLFAGGSSTPPQADDHGRR